MKIEPKRCAIYTRKSHDEGLEQDYNSLDAQRDAAMNYIASQRANGWQALPDSYDDGGWSGGDINRPALQRMITDLRAGLIDIVVVYKIDRLSRSLTDFAELQTEFENSSARSSRNASGTNFPPRKRRENTSADCSRSAIGAIR